MYQYEITLQQRGSLLPIQSGPKGFVELQWKSAYESPELLEAGYKKSEVPERTKS